MPWTPAPTMRFGQNPTRWSRVYCAVAVLIVLLFGAALAPLFAGERGSHVPLCFSNIKQLALATSIYSLDYDDRMPLAARWYDVELPYRKWELKCSSVTDPPEGGPAIGYAFNSKLGGIPSKWISDPSWTIELYDSSNLRRNASDPVITLVTGGRHSGGNNVGYADGHGRWRKWLDDPGHRDPEIAYRGLHVGDPSSVDKRP